MERWGVHDKGLVEPRCHVPTVLLIGPICLLQAGLRTGMGLKYDTDLLHLRLTASECVGRCFVLAKQGAVPCVCPHYGLGYFRITDLLSRMAEAFDTALVFRLLSGTYACR